MKVKIKKFAELQNVEFETPLKIEGKNKLGKTTILNAVAWCLFGKDIEGNEMGVRVYKSSDPIDEQFAEVTIFFGEMQFTRKASPNFTKGGELKSRVNTELAIDLNKVNQAEWEKFFNFKTFKGTKLVNIDLLTCNPLLFLKLDYKDKKAILNEIAVADNEELRRFDLKTMQDKRKTLQKQLNANFSEQELIQKKIKDIIDVEIEEIPEEIIEAREQYLTLSQSDNTELIAKINNENALNLAKIHSQKRELSGKIISIANKIAELNGEIDREKKIVVEGVLKSKKELKDIEEEEKYLTMILSNLNNAKKYTDVKMFYSEHKEWLDEKENIRMILNSISKLKKLEFNGEEANCPITNNACDIAKNNARESFEIDKANKIKAAKENFLYFVELEMKIYNRKYDDLEYDYNKQKEKVDKIQKENYAIIEENKRIEKENAEIILNFEKTKGKKIKDLQEEVEKLKSKLDDLSNELTTIEQTPVETKTLPQVQEISAEMRELNAEWERLNKKLIGATAINENNAKIKDEYNQKKKELKKNYISLVADFEKTSNEIIEYTEKISKKLKNIFDGKYDLSFELFSETLDGEINDDVCNIYANGQVYLNEATTVNVGMQILYGLQKFYGKSYTVLLDRTESVNDIDTYDLDIIYTKVTEDNKLKFTQI